MARIPQLDSTPHPNLNPNPYPNPDPHLNPNPPPNPNSLPNPHPNPISNPHPIPSPNPNPNSNLLFINPQSQTSSSLNPPNLLNLPNCPYFTARFVNAQFNASNSIPQTPRFSFRVLHSKF